MQRKVAPLALLMVACAGAEETADGPESPLEEQAEGWARIEGGDHTGCAHGTDFSFWFRPGSTEDLMVFFQGGGACWAGETCALDRTPTYDPFADENDRPPNQGIFRSDEGANPVREWSMLYIPYCTGDVHVGAATVTYDVGANDSLPARSFEIRHEGDANVQAALDWLYDRIPSPTDVLVTGVSAGALGSAFHAHAIAERYSGARVVQLGDAAGGYRANTTPAVLQTWGGQHTLGRFDGVDPSNADFETFYSDATRTAPNLRMAQFNFHEDQVQLDFLRMLGVADVDLIDLLDANLAEIRSASPGFRSYMAPGSAHGILRTDEFYRAEVDGVSLRDWTADLIAGGEVGTVSCEVCR